MDLEKSKSFAEAHYQGIQIVAGYIQACHDSLLQTVLIPNENYRDGCLMGLFLRVLAWVHSLETLNDSKHYQAMVSGARTLLEITVDLILLHNNKSNEAGERMLAWAESEKLKTAELMVKYFQRQSIPVPDPYQPLEEMYNRRKQEIEDIRKKFWNKTTHPQRWTDHDLLQDIRNVDQVYGSAIQADLGTTLEEFYRTEYSKMNWHIHSGVATFWNLRPETFHLIAGAALGSCCDLAMLSTKVVLRDFRFTDAIDGLSQEWSRIKELRAERYAEVVLKIEVPKRARDEE